MFVVGDIAGKVTDTVVAFNHVHVESALVPKLNSTLHGQVRAEKPDASVRESKVTNTACPLSRSEEHTSELQSPYSIAYAVFCL